MNKKVVICAYNIVTNCVVTTLFHGGNRTYEVGNLRAPCVSHV